MNATLYLQDSLEILVKSQLSKKDTEEDLVSCVYESIKQVCFHHNLSVNDESIQHFLNVLEEDPSQHFQWTKVKGFHEFETFFLKHHLLISEPHSSNAQLQICELEDYVQDFTCTSKSKHEYNTIGVVLVEEYNLSKSKLQILQCTDCVELKTITVFESIEPRYLASVPDSKANVLFIASKSGVCTVAQIIKGDYKKLVEFILDIPEEGSLDGIQCRRCAKEGDLILFWEGYNEKERWKFHTGINEAALKSDKIDRLFRAVSDDEIVFINFTRPQIHTSLNVVCDEYNTRHFVSNGLVVSDCSSLQNKRHALMVMVPLFSFAVKCQGSECTCSLQYFYKGKCGFVKNSGGVKKVHSITMF
jgi:hypothetical protein